MQVTLSQVTLSLVQLCAITKLAARPGAREVTITTRFVDGVPHAEVTVGTGDPGEFDTFRVTTLGAVTS